MPAENLHDIKINHASYKNTSLLSTNTIATSEFMRVGTGPAGPADGYG